MNDAGVIAVSAITDLRAKVFTLLKGHEGCDACMYLDSEGNVTVGIGHALFTAIQAKLLPFLVTATNQPATPLEILKGWNYLKSLAVVGALPNKRIRYPGLYLPEPAVERLCYADLAKFEAVLAATFPQFASYPEPVELALYDMCFNLGSFRKFPHLVMAVRNRNWVQAAAECRREKIGDQRNEDTKAQFLSAVVQVAA
jgi:GH24 family phage-related lysozyme (muramidase)